MDKFDSFKHQTIFSLAKNYEHGRRGFDSHGSDTRSERREERSSKLHSARSNVVNTASSLNASKTGV